MANQELVLTTLLEQRASEDPDTVFINAEGAAPLTNAEMLDASQQFARGLQELGVGKGTTVAVLLENCLEAVVAWFGINALGAVFAPLNTALHGSFLTHQLRMADVRILITSESRLADVAAIQADVAETLTYVVSIDGTTGQEDLTPDVMQFGDVAASGRESSTSLPEPPLPSDPGVILFTSGTTGASKGAVLSHRYMLTVAYNFRDSMQIGPTDVFYSISPLFHAGGALTAVLGSLSAGAALAMDHRFSVTSFWARVRESGATVTLLIGAPIQMLWNRTPDDDERNNSLRTAVLIPSPAKLHAEIEERFGIIALSCYGLTEAGTVTLSSIDRPAPPGSAGPVLPTHEVMIADDDDVAQPAGTPGEILIRPNGAHVLFEGYVGDPGATLSLLGSLWLHTGDIGVMDEAGNLKFLDRKKDYLRRRGENISSVEVEEVLLRHPAVGEVAVIGVPSELSEDEVKACVVPVGDAELEETSFIEYCIDQLPYFAVPRFVDILDALPKTPTGKVQKHELRATHEPDRSWDREREGIKVTRESRLERRTAGAATGAN